MNKESYMNFPLSLRLACFAAITSFALQAQAESLPSSASSAGSASSGSVSASLHESSDSSSKDDKRADGDYRIIDVAEAPERGDFRRVTMQADESQQRIVLDLPVNILDKQGLGRGDLVYAQHRVYGLEFARSDTREAFYLVLADKWHEELAPRIVGL